MAEFPLGDPSQALPREVPSQNHPFQAPSGRLIPMNWTILVLASLTMAIGAANMFALQPMIGKLLAPYLGSVPAVWTTCMLFFQMILLAGYVYVHWLTKFAGLKLQLIIHGVLLGISLFSLPLGLPGMMTSNIPETSYHAPWIFATLLIAVGAPAFVLATTAPLIQSWFGKTNHKLASNPYPLYIASNAGSLLGLLSYPFLVEPNLTLTSQRSLWSISLLIYAFFLAIIAVLCWRYRQESTPRVVDATLRETDSTFPVTGKKTWFGSLHILRWLALSFIPSSLLLGVTSHITTDVAAMPMLWTIPLAIYLLSWTISFADYAPWLHRGIQRLTPLAIIAAAFVWSANFLEHIRLVLFINMMALLMICWALHRQLYESRPEPGRLTTFYIAIALGGALGGIFNALIAPSIFSGFAEYPLALVLSSLFLPTFLGIATLSPSRGREKWILLWQQFVFSVIVVLCTAALSRYAHQSIRWNVWNFDGLSARLGWTNEQLEKWSEYGLPLIPAFLLLGRPKYQAIALCTALVVGLGINQASNVILRERSFFGVLSIRKYSHEGLVHSLVHGGILHGEQWLASESDRVEPLSYYHKDGPLGDVMDILGRRKESFHTAAIGLGTGSVAAYGQSNRPITFFEIDAAVEKIARNKTYFTYVSDCLDRGCPLEVRIGDARVTMAKSAELFDLIVVDAFSSDSIPLHLITREAIDGWLRHLQPDGIIAFHVSNRFISLSPVLGNAAQGIGVSAFERVDTHGDNSIGHSGSHWVVFTSDPIISRSFASHPEWSEASTRPDIPIWTDDFASVLPVIRF